MKYGTRRRSREVKAKAPGIEGAATIEGGARVEVNGAPPPPVLAAMPSRFWI